MEIKNVNIDDLYFDFTKEKAEFGSTLATIELFSDKEALKDINKGLNEIKNGDCKKFSFDEIDKV